ncbi:MAG: MFS transporter [Spirochaetales bacterium]|nr:MFS transporter [Spirochaetales bacterium]
MKGFFASIENKDIQQALIFSIFDGVLWALMFGFAENYLIPFALFFNATAFQISFMQGTMQFGISIAQLIGAPFIQKFKKRKALSITCNIFHASSFLAILFGGIFTKNPWVILISFMFGAFANSIAGPGWISWMNDIVPPDKRGRFWGYRNRIINFAQFTAITLAGILLYLAEIKKNEILIYIILFTIASMARFSSIVPLSKQYEPDMVVPSGRTDFKFRIFLSRLLFSNFGRFTLFSFILTFAVNIMAPIIPVFLIQSLHFNYIQYMIIMMSSMVSSFIAVSYWGPLADRYGNYRILIVTALSIPVIAFGWVFFKNFYLLVIWQLFSGFIWSGFNLSNLNYIFDSIRPENVPKISAYFQSLNNLCAFTGSMVGGLLSTVTGHFSIGFFAANNYEIIFLISGVVRLLCIIILAKRFVEVRKVAQSPGIRYFYIYQPMFNIINRFMLIFNRIRGKK